MHMPNLKHPKQVLVMAHGWGYNHRFFDALLAQLPSPLLESTLVICLESGYFPDQSTAGLVIRQNNIWQFEHADTLQHLALAHGDLPWLGLGHSRGFSSLLQLPVHWHTLFSLHGFTWFAQATGHHAGTPPRLLARMLNKAKNDMGGVLEDFQQRCGHVAAASHLNETALLNDLAELQTLNCTDQLAQVLKAGTRLYAWASPLDQIVPLELAQACFQQSLHAQGSSLNTLAAQHAELAHAPASYTCDLLPLLHQP